MKEGRRGRRRKKKTHQKRSGGYTEMTEHAVVQIRIGSDSVAFSGGHFRFSQLHNVKLLYRLSWQLKER